MLQQAKDVTTQWNAWLTGELTPTSKTKLEYVQLYS